MRIYKLNKLIDKLNNPKPKQKLIDVVKSFKPSYDYDQWSEVTGLKKRTLKTYVFEIREELKLERCKKEKLRDYLIRSIQSYAEKHNIQSEE